MSAIAMETVDVLSKCKQEGQLICSKMEELGEESILLSVNVVNKAVTYLGSNLGRNFLLKRIDIIDNFFAFCNEMYSEKLKETTSGTQIGSLTPGNTPEIQSTNDNISKKSISPSCLTPERIDQQKQYEISPEFINEVGSEMPSENASEIHNQIGSGTLSQTSSQLHHHSIASSDIQMAQTGQKEFEPLPQSDIKPDISNMLQQVQSLEKTSAIDTEKGICDFTELEGSETINGKATDNLVTMYMYKDENEPENMETESNYTANVDHVHGDDIKSNKIKPDQKLSESEKNVNEINESETKTAVVVLEKLCMSDLSDVQNEREVYSDENDNIDSEGDQDQKDLDSSTSFDIGNGHLEENMVNISRRSERKRKPQNYKLMADPKTMDCGLCGKTFKNNKGYVLHMMKHQENKAYRCEECGAEFVNFGLYKIHTNSAHSEHKIHACDVCGKYCKSLGGLKFHQRLHTKPKIDPDMEKSKERVCNICGLTTKNVTGLKRHMLKHDDNSRIKCEQCGKEFVNPGMYTIHLKSVHSENKEHVCDFCGKTFKSVGGLTLHQKQHTEPKDLSCRTCGKVFKFKSDLIRHETIHTGIRPHKCDICKKSFFQPAHLNRHKLIHLVDKPYKCEYCNKQFADKGCYKIHIKIHQATKPCVCDICGKEFSVEERLNAHKKTHTTVPTHFCDICGKGFTLKYYLKCHMDSHITEKTHICEICGKAFKSVKYLCVHKQVHKDDTIYKCLVCGKEFNVMRKLSLHLKIHTNGEKPHVCDICGKRFPLPLYLKRHKLMHLGLKPYSCQICGEKFTQSKSVKRHMLRKHTGK